MLDWLGSEADRMRIAFTKVFGSGPEPFGNQATHVGGWSDGSKGVQWNAAFDPRDGRQWVGVNLEGMMYDDWPVARLIERELADPTLLNLVDKTDGLDGVTVLWRRDFWQARSRPEIQEGNIVPTPIALIALTEAQWRSALEEAKECLDPRRKRRGRAPRTVILLSGARVEGEVSPHLTFEYHAVERTDWEELLRDAKDRMQPLYDWATHRAKAPVRF